MKKNILLSVVLFSLLAASGVSAQVTNIDEVVTPGIWAIFAGFMFVGLIIGIIFYVYFALALMAVAKKTGTEPAWLAWIPIANLYLMSQMAGMHWWPLLLIFVGIIPFIGSIAMLVLSVYSIIWWWKIFEKIGKPGWWAILLLVPIVNLIILGIAAWGKSGGTRPSPLNPSAPIQ